MLSKLFGFEYPTTGTLVFWTIQTVAIISIFLWFYNYVRYKQSFWERHGVPGPEPIFLLGTQLPFGIRPWPDVTMERFRKYGKIYGDYLFLQPVLNVQDADMAKQILIKDFPQFLNRQKLPTYHELLNQNMLFSRDEKWKRMRTIASPSFTSGKLRNLAPLMNNCIDKLFKYFDKIIDHSGEAIIETKQVMSGFTMDVIAWTSFGTDTHANDSTNRDQHPFIKYGLGLFRVDRFRAIAVFLFPPIILKFLGIKTLNSPKSFDYFIDLTREVIRQRKNQSQVNGGKIRQDLLQMMLDAEVDENELEERNLDKLIIEENDDQDSIKQSTKSINGITKKMTESEVIANSIFFFIAGFETTASTISHCLYNLAWNPEIQERLHSELVTVLEDKNIDSQEYFETVMKSFPLFEAVIKETLRLYPPVTILNRSVSVDEFNLNGIPLPRDTIVRIGVHVIHHMEEYYENPEKFLPERWLSPNKERLQPYAYMPFGLGPRNCVGMRFAYQEIRLALARILIRYRFVTTPDTPQKLSFGPRSPLLITSPFNLKIIPR